MKKSFKNTVLPIFAAGIMFASAIALLAGCSSRTSSELITIELKKSYPKLEVPIQELADVEYIPLETGDRFLLTDSPQLFYADDEYIMMTDRATDHEGRVVPAIFIYDRSGRAINMINRRGNGPGEYLSLSNPAYDPSTKEIFFHDRQRSSIFVYDVAGRFIRQLAIQGDAREGVEAIKIWDISNLIIYTPYPLSPSYEGAENFFKTASIISKQDGSTVKEIDIKFEKRLQAAGNAPYPNGTGMGTIITMLFSIQRSGEDFLLSEISADTIFRLSRYMKLTPAAVRRPSVAKNDETLFLQAIHETHRYFFTYILDMGHIEDMIKGPNVKYLICDKKENKIYDLALYNDDYTARTPFAISRQSFVILHRQVRPI